MKKIKVIFFILFFLLNANANSAVIEIKVKVRSTGRLLKSKLDLSNGMAKLNLLEDEYGISPGQACVFYSKDELGFRVLGGGWISKN